MCDRRGVGSVGVSVNSRSRRKRLYVFGVIMVCFEVVYKFVIMVVLLVF